MSVEWTSRAKSNFEAFKHFERINLKIHGSVTKASWGLVSNNLILALKNDRKCLKKWNRKSFSFSRWLLILGRLQCFSPHTSSSWSLHPLVQFCHFWTFNYLKILQFSWLRVGWYRVELDGQALTMFGILIFS